MRRRKNVKANSNGGVFTVILGWDFNNNNNKPDGIGRKSTMFAPPSVLPQVTTIVRNCDGKCVSGMNYDYSIFYWLHHGNFLGNGRNYHHQGAQNVHSMQMPTTFLYDKQQATSKYNRLEDLDETKKAKYGVILLLIQKFMGAKRK